ncbi:DUF3667 domain-containing protein [Limibacter armeniacum]|uniref:DUF3667 domain-containing protein n=1 Tax=Limibacter armeniacum TaxID=466084 RepID=UPI002FE5DB6D
MSFRILCLDFIENLFSFDSKIGRSVIPFIFAPGKLTNEFLAGKRVKYVHPIRIYLACSILFFLLIGLSNRSTHSVGVEGGLAEMQDSLEKELALADTVTDLPMGIKHKVDEELNPNLLLAVRLFMLSKEQRNLSDDAFLDSLGVQSPSYIKKTIFLQSRKAIEDNGVQLTHAVLNNIPQALFILLPLFGLLLGLFYYRLKRYYVEHLVFSIHLHAYFFFWMILIWLVGYLPSSTSSWLYYGLFTMLCWYVFQMFRRVYKEKWSRSLMKMGMIGSIYSVFVIIVISGAMLITAMIF